MSLLHESREGMGGQAPDFDALRERVKSYPDPSLDYESALRGEPVPSHEFRRVRVGDRTASRRRLGAVATTTLDTSNYRSGPDFPNIAFAD